MKAFKVVVGDNMIDVPGRILQTPRIVYGQVSVSSLDHFSVIYTIIIGYESSANQK